MSDLQNWRSAAEELRKLGYRVETYRGPIERLIAEVTGPALERDEKYVVLANPSRFPTFAVDGSLWGLFYLRWNGDGEQIVERLQSKGLNVEWDGSAFECIRLMPAEKGASA